MAAPHLQQPFQAIWAGWAVLLNTAENTGEKSSYLWLSEWADMEGTF